MRSPQWFPVALVAVLFLAASLACSPARFWPGRDADVPPERTVVVSQEAATEAQQQLAEARTSGTLRMNEAQFTSLIAQQMDANSDAPLQDITVWFEPDTVVIQGRVQEGILPMGMGGEMTLSGQLTAQNGDPVFTIETANVAGVPLPDAVVTRINETIDAGLADLNLGGIRIRAITVTQGEIVIEQEQ